MAFPQWLLYSRTACWAIICILMVTTRRHQNFVCDLTRGLESSNDVSNLTMSFIKKLLGNL